MTWRDLLAKIGGPDPWTPEPHTIGSFGSVPTVNGQTAALIEASADRAGVVNRRAFLQLAGAAVALVS